MKEIIDVYSANQIKIGSADRSEVHKKGLWHKTFHCWILTKIKNINYLVFQLRSPSISFPNLLDISVAGHFLKGETKKNITREIKEELGLGIIFTRLYYLGQRTEVIDIGEIKNREFQDIFMINIPNFLNIISPNTQEINGIFWLSLKSSLQLFSNKKKSFTIDGIEFNKESQNWVKTKKIITIKNFVPRMTNYYLSISINGKRLLKNEFPLSI